MNWIKRKRPLTSVLALSLTGGRLEAVTLRRTNGSISVEKNFAAALGLNPLTGDPELVGREIRNNLDQAGIRDRKCVVCIPLSWVLVQAVETGLVQSPRVLQTDAVV